MGVVYRTNRYHNKNLEERWGLRASERRGGAKWFFSFAAKRRICGGEFDFVGERWRARARSLSPWNANVRRPFPSTHTHTHTRQMRVFFLSFNVCCNPAGRFRITRKRKRKKNWEMKIKIKRYNGRDLSFDGIHREGKRIARQLTGD